MKVIFVPIFSLILLSGVWADSTPQVSSSIASTSLVTDSTVLTTAIPSSTRTSTSAEPITTKASDPSSTAPTDPPTTSSVKPTTASTEPPTTASTEPPTTASTEPPTTASTELPTTSAKPPVPQEGSWNVTVGNLTCIRANLKVLFIIPLEKNTEYIALSPGASSAGSDCNDNGTQTLVLEDSNYKLTMYFDKASKNVFVKNITFSYSFPGEADMVYNDTKLFTVNAGNSYLCHSIEKIALSNVTMEISEIRIEAFGSVGKKGFSEAEECEADDKVSDIVPIAVGIALGALIIVVIIAYLVGRRRSRQRGYQSV